MTFRAQQSQMLSFTAFRGDEGEAYSARHRYPEAAHAFFALYRPMYRAGPVVDGWGKVMAFFGKHLAAG